MTHTLDIGTDLDDLLASIGDLSLDAHDASDDTAPASPADETPAFLSPKLIRGAWYR